MERKSFGGLVGGRGGEENFACMGRKVSWCSGIAVVGSVTWRKTDDAWLCLACSHLMAKFTEVFGYFHCFPDYAGMVAADVGYDF
jgi:hypothetical protein